MLRRFIEAARIASGRRYRPVLSEMKDGAVVDAMDELHESDIAAWRAACSYYHHTRPEPVSIHRRWPDAPRLGWFHAFRLAWTRIADAGPRRRPASGTRRRRTIMYTVHPSPEAVRLAVSRIQRAVDARGGDREVVMDWGIVHRDGCRTLACHAGWYALGRFMDHPAILWRHDETFHTDPGETMMALRQDGTVSHVMHYEGAHMLARDLGFMNAPALKGWAGRHPEIWGNRRGRRMFDYDGAPAFGKPRLAPIMVSEIVAWWRAVADRLDAAIPVHPDRISALAALEGYAAPARETTAVESSPGGYRLVRRPYPADLLSLQA